MLVASSIYTLKSEGAVKVDPYFPGAEVRYYKPSLHSGPGFIVKIRDTRGRALPALVSLYVWMPNGSVVSLGVYAGRGDVAANYSLVREAMLAWRSYLGLQGNDPDLVEPGILILGAIHGKNGVYPILRAITLDTAMLLKGLSITVVIVEDLEGRIPLVEGVPVAGGYSTDVEAEDKPIPLPGNAEKVCYQPSGAGKASPSCYVWSLESVLGLKLGSGLPLAAAYIHGEVEALNSVVLLLAFQSQSSEGLEIGFGVSASITNLAMGKAEYEVLGFTTKLLGDRIWLYSYKRFVQGINITSPTIAAVGVKGDAALLKYRLYLCPVPGETEKPICSPTSVVAEISMARPAISNDQLVFWYGADKNPDDGTGLLEQGFKAYKNNWLRFGVQTDPHGAALYSLDIQRQIATLPSLSVSINVFDKDLGVPVGSTGVGAPAKIIGAIIGLDSRTASNYTIMVEYFYSPHHFKYGGGRYPMGSMYLDIQVIPVSSGG